MRESRGNKGGVSGREWGEGLGFEREGGVERDGGRDGAGGEGGGGEHDPGGGGGDRGDAGSTFSRLCGDVSSAYEDSAGERESLLHRASEESVRTAAVGERELDVEVYGGRDGEEPVGGFSGAQENFGGNRVVSLSAHAGD